MTNDYLAAAHAAADEAEALRQDLRWNVKPGTTDREELIDAALEMLRLAMIPIRAQVGKTVWGLSDFPEAKLRDASARIQYQRKQLKKMKRG